MSLTQDGVEITTAFNSYFVDSVKVLTEPLHRFLKGSALMNDTTSEQGDELTKELKQNVFGLDSTFLKLHSHSLVPLLRSPTHLLVRGCSRETDCPPQQQPHHITLHAVWLQSKTLHRNCQLLSSWKCVVQDGQKGHCWGCVSRKAFDTVNHEVLITKLNISPNA